MVQSLFNPYMLAHSCMPFTTTSNFLSQLEYSQLVVHVFTLFHDWLILGNKFLPLNIWMLNSYGILNLWISLPSVMYHFFFWQVFTVPHIVSSIWSDNMGLLSWQPWILLGYLEIDSWVCHFSHIYRLLFTLVWATLGPSPLLGYQRRRKKGCMTNCLGWLRFQSNLFFFFYKFAHITFIILKVLC